VVEFDEVGHAPTVGTGTDNDRPAAPAIRIDRVSEPGWLGRADRWGRAHGWAADVLLALTCAAVLGALSISGAQGIHWSTTWALLLVACFAVLHVTVALRRHLPLLAFGLACAAMLVIVLAPYGRIVAAAPGAADQVPALVLPSSLLFLLDLYSVAALLDVLRSRIALGVTLAGVALAAATTSGALDQIAAGRWLVAAYVALALGAGVLLTWNLGRLALVRQQRARTERVEAARLAVLEERARIAREMHDIVAHSLAVIVRQAEGGALVANSDASRAVQAFMAIAGTGRDALAEMRGLLGVLRDPGAVQADPQPGLAELPQLVAGVRDTGLDARFAESGEPFAIAPAAELAVYRLVQEGLTNVVKHAGTSAHVLVHLDWRDGRLTAEVSDDGGGRPAALPGTGAGLQGLHDRLAAVGGSFSAAPHGTGFRVRAGVPAAEATR
jgi:signal transduction histidine kinase